MFARKVVNISVSVGIFSGSAHCVDDIGHEVEVADLFARVEKFDCVVGDGADAVNAGVQAVVVFRRQFVDAVDVGRLEEMIFVDGQINRFTVNLAGACVNYDGDGREVAARFRQGELCAKIDFHIHERLRHAVEVRNMPREVIWTRSLIVATLKRFAP